MPANRKTVKNAIKGIREAGRGICAAMDELCALLKDLDPRVKLSQQPRKHGVRPGGSRRNLTKGSDSGKDICGAD